MPKPRTVTDALLELVVPMAASGEPLLIGLSGAQGCGKTTSTNALKKIMGDDVAVLALDDFYLTLAERQALAKTVSTLFETRGVPATHDIALLEATIAKLQTQKDFEPVSVPVFSKPIDDRLPKAEWMTIKKQPKLILVEGWCMGATLLPLFVESEPLNDVERADESKAWRTYQAKALVAEYAQFWEKFDTFIHIRAPRFDVVKNWRIEQEADNMNVPKGQLPKERIEWVEKFIQHYQRLTEAMISGYHMEGCVISIDSKRRVTHTDIVP